MKTSSAKLKNDEKTEVVLKMRRYDMGFKMDAIKLAKEVGATKTAKELDIPQSTLDTWIVKHNRGDYDNIAVTPKQALSLADENKRLAQEVRELKRVNKILKDASAFFAQSQKK